MNGLRSPGETSQVSKIEFEGITMTLSTAKDIVAGLDDFPGGDNTPERVARLKKMIESQSESSNEEQDGTQTVIYETDVPQRTLNDIANGEINNDDVPATVFG